MKIDSPRNGIPGLNGDLLVFGLIGVDLLTYGSFSPRISLVFEGLANPTPYVVSLKNGSSGMTVFPIRGGWILDAFGPQFGNSDL